jgi:hypothetical protein
MDLRVSKKETRYLPVGQVEVLVPGAFDVFPIFSAEDPNLIVDVECITDEAEERRDRAEFSTIKQRGSDPLDPEDGIQWAESLLEEVSPDVIMFQIQEAVKRESPVTNVIFEARMDAGGVTRLVYSITD